MEILIPMWLALCGAVAILANRYNRSALTWFFTSALFSPLVGFAFVLALGPITTTKVQSGYRPRTGDHAPSNPPNQGSALTYRGSRFKPAF